MMARNTADPLQKLEEQLTCSLCLELYKNPKNLPCQHSFCQDCLGNCPCEVREGTNFLKCPECRKPAQLPLGGVRALPPAFTINSLFELYKAMQAKQDTMDCPQHKQSLDGFCNTCQELVCADCITPSHNNHHVQMVSCIIHDCKQQLEDGLQPVKQQIAAVVDAMRDLNACDGALVHQGEAVKQEIHSQVLEAKAALDQAERNLIEEVEKVVQQKRRIIALQMQEGQDELAQLQRSIEFVERSMKVQSDKQIVASKTKILDRIEASVSRAKKCRLKPAEGDDIKYEGNRRVLEQCKKFGILTHTHLSQKCRLTLRPVAPGRKARCQLSTGDTPIPTSLISCQVTASNGPQPADCTITETGPGIFEINYTPVVCGLHHLRVTVGGSEIPGSVFSVPVLPPSPETRGQPLRTIQGLETPTFIAVSRRGQIIVSETGADCITIFSSELQRIVSVGSSGVGTDHFNGPAGIAITDNDRRVLVTDCGNHRIQVLTIEGQFLASVGTQGKGPLQFEFPTSIAVHPNRQVLVSERDSNRIQVLNDDLTFSHSFVTRGSRRGKGKGHGGLAVDSRGIVYISDTRDGCVQQFSIRGQFIAQFGSSGIANGKLTMPFGIVVDNKDYVYVGEILIQRISIFTSSRKFVHCFEMRGEGEKLDGEDVGLSGLAVDKNGNLYACNSRKGEVVIF